MKVIASLLVTVTAFLRNTEVVHADKVNKTALPFNYYHCFDGTCNHGNDIAVDAGCQDMRWFSMTDKGADFKKLGSGIKVTYYMRNRCEQYHSYQHTLDCTSADEEVTWSNKGEFTVQSYKVESCV